MSSLRFKLVTPEKLLVEEEAYSVTLPAAEGEITVLPDHIPYIGTLRPGEIFFRRTKEAEPESFATSGGFVELHGNTLSLLVDTAERAEEIDLDRAEEGRRKAEELGKNQHALDEAEYARVAASIEKEFARLRVARKYRHRHGIRTGE